MEDAAPHSNEFPDAFELAFGDLRSRIEMACEVELDWPSGVAAGIQAALEFAASQPEAIRTLTTEALASGRPGFACYERLIFYLGDLLAPGREESSHGERLPEEMERALAGGIAMLVAQRIDLGRHAELPALAAEATQFALTPYLGIDEAKRVSEGRG